MWIKNGVQGQKSTVTRCNSLPIKKFNLCTRRFEHIHVDIVELLSISNQYKYCLTIVDRFLRWPEAIFVEDISAETISKKIFYKWIA